MTFRNDEASVRAACARAAQLSKARSDIIFAANGQNAVIALVFDALIDGVEGVDVIRYHISREDFDKLSEQELADCFFKSCFEPNAVNRSLN